jgi:serine/threonine protein kinase
LLLSEKSENAKVLLAGGGMLVVVDVWRSRTCCTDFGLAALIDNGQAVKAAVGTPGYIAPEVLKTLDDDALTYGQVWRVCDALV